ncbi:glycoside hydrolase family 2 protein [Ferruginibacter sp.]
MIKFFCFFLLLVSSLQIANAQRQKYNFNSNWKVLTGDDSTAINNNYNDASWKNVTLPYAWNEDDAFKKDIVDLRTGIAWYRKHFKLPAAAKAQKIFIEFEGIRQAGEFYVNGKYIGLHENGVMAFGFDITDVVNFGNSDNVIAVRIDNSWDYREKATNSKFQWEDKNFNANYGGISKNVFLHITPKVYQTLPLYAGLQTTGVYIYADNYSIKEKLATIHAESEVKNESGQPQQVVYRVAVRDNSGKLVKTFTRDKINLAPGETKIITASSLVNDLNFWSWGYGYLYNVQTSLLVNNKPVDIVNTTTGFRKTEFKDGMIYLNDRVMMVHG